jgi:hypothetical protein
MGAHTVVRRQGSNFTTQKAVRYHPYALTALYLHCTLPRKIHGIHYTLRQARDNRVAGNIRQTEKLQLPCWDSNTRPSGL